MEDYREDQIKLANAMKRLVQNEDFKFCFEEVYLKAFALTNMQKNAMIISYVI